MADDRLTFTDTDGPICGLRVVVGSSVFICRAPQGHPTAPGHEHQGYGGRGHAFVGAGRVP